MDLTQVYDRIEALLETIRTLQEEPGLLINCETELASLEQLREELEEGA